MRRVAWVWLATLGAHALAGSLDPETAAAWEHYLASAESAMEARRWSETFLASDRKPKHLERLRDGEILVSPSGDSTPQRIPHGLIHHWEGAVFIPDASVEEFLATVRDYASYASFYPGVVDAKLLARTEATDRFFTLETHRTPFSTIALDGDFLTRYFGIDAAHGYTISRATRLQQIQNYGQPDQRELGAFAPNAYLWDLYTIARFEQRDGGLYLELEAIALSRGIPVWIRWLVTPFVRAASADSLATRLAQIRDAVLARRIGSVFAPP